MPRVLIISPYFPPSNAPDMQRLRMSLPFYKEFGWEVEVVCVDDRYSDFVKDPLFSKTIPEEIPIHKVRAFSRKWTRFVGLGNMALRSFFFYMKKVNEILGKGNFDLIYFSTTMYPISVLGPYWKKKFAIPYIIDIQDPWHTEYYRNKPKSEQPPKYWFSYHLNKLLEPIAMGRVGGLLSVSKAYIDELKERYPRIGNIPCSVVTFGFSEVDYDVAMTDGVAAVPVSKEEVQIVYVGVLGKMMLSSLSILFESFKKLLVANPAGYSHYKFYFIGTSYAVGAAAKMTALPIATALGLERFVIEITERVSFFDSIATLSCADGTIILGTDDPGYTASKLYPYILAHRPLLGIVHPQSSIVKIVEETKAGDVVTLDENRVDSYAKVESFLQNARLGIEPDTDWDNFRQYSAREMTRRQCVLFDKVIGLLTKSSNDARKN